MGKLCDDRPDLKPNTVPWWDAKGQRYDRNRNGRDRPHEYEAAAALCIGPVIEIGSALGAFSKYLPRQVHYVGMEISPFMCRRARERFKKRAFVNCNAISVPPGMHGAFRTAVALQVIEHFKNPTDIVDAARRLARERLVFSVPRQGYNAHHYKNDGHVSWWATGEEFKEFFGRFGKLTMWKGDKHHRCGVIEWINR